MQHHLALFAVIVACAGALRGTPPQQKKKEGDVIAEAMKMVGSMNAHLAADHVVDAPPPPPSLTKLGNHSVLDFGFKGYEATILKDVVAALNKVESQNKTQNLTALGETSVNAVFKDTFMAVKKTVAKNWMELKPEKRDQYAETLKTKFHELFTANEGLVVKALGSRLKLHQEGEDLAPVLRKVLSLPLRTLSHSLGDYTDLVYMSSIFIKFRSTMKKTQLSTLATNAELEAMIQ